MNEEPNRTIDDEWIGATKNNVQLVYFLYLASFLLGGIPSLVGVVMAYMYRGKADEVLASHYTWQIRTFWIGMLLSLIGAVLMLVAIGYLLILAVAVWVIIRCVKGLQRIAAREAIPDPMTWWI